MELTRDELKAVILEVLQENGEMERQRQEIAEIEERAKNEAKAEVLARREAWKKKMGYRTNYYSSRNGYGS